jgi:hypothetical protein
MQWQSARACRVSKSKRAWCDVCIRKIVASWTDRNVRHCFVSNQVVPAEVNEQEQVQVHLL